ncbi:MAG: choice-of-anchor tandem repeat GloVer-containing protein [Terracidiphilus sp.]|jgi:uncharacterized repeat protein (TIGR03803 family)
MRTFPHEVLGRAKSFAAAVLILLAATIAAHATTATESTLFSFSGDQPSQLIQAHDGNFYGTSPTGGTDLHGYVFQLTPSGTETVIYNFTNGADGGTPQSSLIEGNDGNLYGTNTTGGSGSGVLFSLTLAGVITPLHSFVAATDGSSAGALIQDNAGNIFGAASLGGASNLGTVFEYTGGAFVLVHAFTGTAGDGSRPNSQLLEASDGLIYGATARGGSSNAGSLFRFDPATPGSLATIGSFPPTGMADPDYNPSLGMTEGTDGALYGLTAEGGTGYGTIYKVVLGAVPTVTLDLFDFVSFPDGGLPESGFFLGGDGNLYGTTSSYGPGGPPNGTFFQYIPAGSGTFTTLYGFSAGMPTGTPLQAADSNFYGSDFGPIYKVVLSPAIPAPVIVTAGPSPITLGSSTTLTWQVNNAFSQTFENCYAHGDWSGSQAISGSLTVTPASTGVFNYSLTCGGTESASASVTVNPAVSPATATPVITPPSGTYTHPVLYNITDATPGAVIHYTTNGATPTLASPVWNNIPKVIVTSTIVKAIAIAPPLTVSGVATADYVIKINPKNNCSIEYPHGFFVNPELQLNHGALIAGAELDLTHGLLHENTSAFAKPRIPLALFASEFRFRFLKATPASSEGLTFTVQANSDLAVGAANGGLGYEGIPHSMALKFDLHNDAGEGNNSVGLFFGGAFPAIPAINLTPSGINLHSGHVLDAYVTYDTHFLTLNLKDTVTAATFTHTFHLPPVSPFGAPSAYAGFTASTGLQTSTAQIIDWTLESEGSCRKE